MDVISGARTEAPAETPGIVSNVTVISDKVADISSIEAWRTAYLKPGMTDQEKALAAWRTVVAHQHQNTPPAEFLHSPENALLDPIKMFNVYGYGLCSVHASHVAALARAAGLTARNQTIQRHCVAEVFWDGEWHMLDASLSNYFPKPDGKIASVQEIIAAVRDFYATHPELQNNPDALARFCKDPGWKTGPKLLADCPFYNENGLFPQDWPWQCGWPESMREYDCTGKLPFVYEPGYSMGYRVNVQLREGERLTRNWFNHGAYLPKPDGKPPTCLQQKVGEGPMSYSPHYGDLAPGRVGNGILEYQVPLASGAFRAAALSADNLAAISEDGQSPALHVKDPTRSGTLIIRMPSSYVYLTGELSFDAVIGPAGKITTYFSENNGLDWKEINTTSAPAHQSIDLAPFVLRRYDYQLKFEFTGPGTGLNSLHIRHDIQHSQRPLPALAQGNNTITFKAQPNEGTITIEGSTLLANRGAQVLCADFHPQLENIDAPMLSVKTDRGSVTFLISTPGPITRLRIFAFYRARAPGDSWNVEVSFDAGNTYQNAGRLTIPFKAMGQQLTVTNVPPGITSAHVRFAGSRTEEAMLFNVRIDADYTEPRGGFRPVKVTYVWEEQGQEKRHIHVANASAETYQINCPAPPLMKTLIVELHH